METRLTVMPRILSSGNSVYYRRLWHIATSGNYCLVVILLTLFWRINTHSCVLVFVHNYQFVLYFEVISFTTVKYIDLINGFCYMIKLFMVNEEKNS